MLGKLIINANLLKKIMKMYKRDQNFMKNNINILKKIGGNQKFRKKNFLNGLQIKNGTNPIKDLIKIIIYKWVLFWKNSRIQIKKIRKEKRNNQKKFLNNQIRNIKISLKKKFNCRKPIKKLNYKLQICKSQA